MPAPATQTVEADGRRLRVSNLSKVLYSETGTTKADVIGYYTAIAPVLIPYSRGRPVTRKRWPNGVGTDTRPIEAFFEKDLGVGVPDWVRRLLIQHSSGPKLYPLVETGQRSPGSRNPPHSNCTSHSGGSMRAGERATLTGS